MAKNSAKKRESQLFRKHLKSFRQKNTQDNLLPANAKVVYSPEGELKISDAIEEIIAPVVDESFTQAAYEKLIGLAAMAWNATLMPAKKRTEMINHLKGLETDPEIQKTLMELFELLMARKRKLYPDEKRTIIDCRITDLGHAYHLSVISTLPKGEEAA